MTHNLCSALMQTDPPPPLFGCLGFGCCFVLVFYLVVLVGFGWLVGLILGFLRAISNQKISVNLFCLSLEVFS